MTLPTMKAGDRVRITVEGFVNDIDGGRVFMALNNSASHYPPTVFHTSELTAPTARVEVLPPPVDPDLVLAREVVAEVIGSDFPKTQADFRDGLKDDFADVRIALSAIKAARAGKAVQG